MTKTKSKKAAPNIFPEIPNKISIKRALSVIETTKQNVLKIFLLLSNCKKLSLIATKATSSSLADFLPYYNKHTRAKKRPKTSGNIWCSLTEITQQNNFKVTTTLDTTTLEYYQSIYTHCKQRFNIPDGIEVVKKSVYQYIENCINNYLFGNYNISEVRSNLYNILVHYLQLETEDFNNKTLATYFQELNFNIIKYCEETYPVQSQYSIDFESETETSNKSKQKLKQYSKTTPNTPILPKTTAKHLQTPEQGTSSKLLLTITPFPALLAQTQTPNSPLNQFARLEDFTLPKSSTRQQEPLQTSSNLLDFLAENQSEHSETAVNEENDSEISEEESIDSENKEDKMTAYITKIPEFNRKDIATSPQEWLNQVTKAGDVNGWNAARIQICQLETNDYYSDAQILDQFITGLKDKLIKKIRPHAPEDLNSAIQHAKRYKMAMEKANHTKLVNLAIGETSSAAEEKIDQLAKKSQSCHYCGIPGHWKKDCKKLKRDQQNRSNQSILTTTHTTLSSVCSKINPAKLIYTTKLIPISRNPAQPRPTHYHTQPSYLTIPEEQDFHYTALSKTRIAENANLSDIFPFEFEANKLPFLLSNVAANKQKAITAMYTEAEVEEKAIRLILNTQTIIVTANGMKKTPVGEIDNFSFTLDGITIPVKVLVMDTQELTISYQEQHARIPATCGTFNKHSEKAPAFEFKPEEEKPIIETFMALGSTSNWADETEQHALNKLYHYSYDAKIIFDLAMALINEATKEDVRQMKEAEYIEYTIELAGFDYEDEVEVYHQIASHTYPTQEAQIQ
ncbi:hypothetical protein G9A89_013092 [Geosiphon pyriformis]|nr:hypothetical protein G9A89_013092 [Geosiphon pyriformis]